MRYIGSNFDNFYAYLGQCPHLNWRRYCSIGSLERSQASGYHLVVFWAFFLLFVETILSFFLKLGYGQDVVECGFFATKRTE
jgi:hypothetical protein